MKEEIRFSLEPDSSMKLIVEKTAKLIEKKIDEREARRAEAEELLQRLSLIHI